MHPVLQQHLEPVARAHRRAELGQRLVLGWLVAAAIGGLAWAAHRVAGWQAPWVFVLWATASVVWTAWAIGRSTRRPLDYAMLARRIEQEEPTLHALLLTAVEQEPDRATQSLNFLQERLIREAMQHPRAAAWGERAHQRLGRVALAVVVVGISMAWVAVALYQMAPPQVAWKRMVSRSVEVTPGDTSLEAGTSLVVLARFNGEVPRAATLIVHPANAPARRLPLTKNLDDPTFGVSVSPVAADLTYEIEYDQARTRSFRVSTFTYPRLEKADANLTYPAYTRLAAKTIPDVRRLSAIEGTAVAYTFQLNKPVASARLIGTNQTSLPLHVDPQHPTRYVSQFTLAQSGRYELILVDEAGRTNRQPPTFVLETLTNRRPELQMAFPRGDQRVSPLEEMAFQASASDDFGLAAYGLAYNLAGQEEKVLTLGTNAGPHEKRTFNHLLALEGLRAEPDQLLSYHLWADDTGPDGQVRRTYSDLYFAEVRPFDEVFREGQAQDPNQSEQSQQNAQGQNGGQQAARLAELQKQIITATWNLQRRETGAKPGPAFQKDAGTVQESQEQALEQLRSQAENNRSPRASAQTEEVARAMETAAVRLREAASQPSTKPLGPALAAEQSAYQALMRMAARETQVAQGQPGQQGRNSRGNRSQRQMNQLNLRQSRNQYETERQAAPPQDAQQREQAQAFNRLKELAQRQQDVNERLRELQAALQEARPEAEREELRERLKRLQEEQQQMLADVDELRQRVEQSSSAAQSAEQRQQLENARSDVSRAAEAMNQGDVARALSSGNRAQQNLQELRDQARRQTSSQFAEEMRSLRDQARELARQEEEIGKNLESIAAPSGRKQLTDTEERQKLATQMDEQKKRLGEVTQRATDLTQKAEAVEPMLARQLYDTLRQASQDDARNLQETAEDLLGRGRLARSVYDQLTPPRGETRQAVEVVARLLRDGFPAEASNLEERARRSLTTLKTGVERAAEGVLGDDTEALRRARAEVEELARQLETEIAQARSRAGTNAAGRGPGAAEADQETPRRASNEANAEQGRRSQGQAEARTGQSAAPGEPGQRGEGQPSANTPGGREDSNEQRTAGTNPGGERRAAGNNPGGDNQRGGRGGDNLLDELGGPDSGRNWDGPLTGTGFTSWSDRLRDVEEMLDVPELRAEVARIRDRARVTRLELRRHARAPQWDVVQTQISGPLLELRSRLSEELAKRETKDAVVPSDRDPVPPRFAERVRRYYERLGKND